MRHFINIVESVKRAPFILHPELNPENYVMTGSLRDYKNWKAIQYEGYSKKQALAGEKRNAKENTRYFYPIKGEMGEIGYVMISLIDNTIIPISRADEHLKGYVVLRDICKNISASPKNYKPVWCGGLNYIYYPDEIPKWLNVISKFLSYGGIDGVMEGIEDMSGLFVKMSDFVKYKGNFTITRGELAIMGKEFIERYKNVAKLIALARNDQFSKTKIKAAFKESYELIDFLKKLVIIPWDDLIQTEKQISVLENDSNISGLEQLLFSNDSLKNKLHTEMKNTSKTDVWLYPKFKKIFGDVDLAIDMLGRF